MSKNIFICALFACLLLSIFTVSAAVTIIAPDANTAQRATVNFSANFSTLANVTEANVTNISLELINDNGTSYNLTVSNGNAVNFTVLSINLNTNNGTFGDANYTFRAGVTFSNGTRATATNTNITIDNTAPVVTILQPAAIYLQNFTNVSVLQDTNITFRATDLASSMHMNCTIEYDTDFNGVSGNIKVENAAVTNNTLTNFSKFNQTVNGNFLIQVVCKDNAGNEGNSTTVMNTTVDNVAPNVTVLTIPAKLDFGDKIGLHCKGTDNIGPASINITLKRPTLSFFGAVKSIQKATGSERAPTGQTFNHTFTETEALGDYVVMCNMTDAVGNVNSTNKTFQVIRKQLSSVPPPSAPTVGKKIITSGSFSNIGAVTATGTARLMANRATMNFELADGSHSLYVKSLTETSVTFVISSEPQEFSLNPGSSEDIDLDQDGTNDVKITLHGISRGKADVTLAKASPSSATTEQETGEGAPGITPSVTQKAKSSKVLWWTIIIIIILIILFLLIRRGKTSGPKFKKKDLGGTTYGGPTGSGSLRAPSYPGSPSSPQQLPPQQPQQPQQQQSLSSPQPPEKYDERYANAPYKPPKKKPEQYY